MKDYIKIGIDKKLIDIIDDGKKILYTHQNKKYNYISGEEPSYLASYITKSIRIIHHIDPF